MRAEIVRSSRPSVNIPLTPTSRRRRRLACGAVLVALCAGAPFAAAQDFPRYGDDVYEPKLRQPGKDVMWLPTSDAMVLRMLNAAKTTPRDVVYDLGAGEGRIPIAAAREFGATAVGIEYDAELAQLAARNAERAGVADRVRIIRGDIFTEDFSKATVVTLYLLPDLNFQLRPQLLEMKPGTRVVSHMWDMGEWEPDETFRSGASEGFLWIVPAPVAGRWTLREEDGRWWGDVTLTQRFQRVGGTLTLRGGTQPLLGAYVNGATVGFTFVDPFGAVRTLRAQIDGDALVGHVRFVSTTSPVTGRRTARPAPRAY